MSDAVSPGFTPSSLAVAVLDPQTEQISQTLAQRLNFPFVGAVDPRRYTELPLLLGYQDHKLSLLQTGRGAPGPVYADFVEGEAAHRRLHGGGRGQPVAKAVGLKPGVTPSVLDATAGLGRDAFVLASLGCEVTLLERSPVIAALLEDALVRAQASADVAPIAARMKLLAVDANCWLRQGTDTLADVIFLDPMFPHREKSSLVKKEMRVFRDLVGADQDSSELLELALQRARYRVVVKRPRLAPTLDERKPSLVLEGKSGRFDVYTLKSLDGLKQA